MLGFTINSKKSELFPSQQLQFLGFIIDSTSMTVHLAQEKVHNVLQMCDTALENRKFSIRFLAHIVGTLQSYNVAVDYGMNHVKLLEIDLITGLKR